jgi:hypothetical protein
VFVIVAESFLSGAGWLFFTAWSAIVALVSLAAFAEDILPTGVFPTSTRRDPKDHL